MHDPTPPIGNLGPKGRRGRLTLGLIAAVVAVGGLAWVAIAQPAMPQRLLVAVAFFVAGLGIFQAQAST